MLKEVVKTQKYLSNDIFYFIFTLTAKFLDLNMKPHHKLVFNFMGLLLLSLIFISSCGEKLEEPEGYAKKEDHFSIIGTKAILDEYPTIIDQNISQTIRNTYKDSIEFIKTTVYFPVKDSLDSYDIDSSVYKAITLISIQDSKYYHQWIFEIDKKDYIIIKKYCAVLLE